MLVHLWTNRPAEHLGQDSHEFSNIFVYPSIRAKLKDGSFQRCDLIVGANFLEHEVRIVVRGSSGLEQIDTTHDFLKMFQYIASCILIESHDLRRDE